MLSLCGRPLCWTGAQYHGIEFQSLLSFYSLGGFGTFLFFGIVNLCFFPFIWLFYVETKGRTLEEIDVIFAKAYSTKEWYVKVGAEMPKLSSSEIESEAMRWGLGGDAEHRVGSKVPSVYEDNNKS